MGDGTENVIHESGTIGIRELFTMTYRTYEYQRDVKVGGEVGLFVGIGLWLNLSEIKDFVRGWINGDY